MRLQLCFCWLLPPRILGEKTCTCQLLSQRTKICMCATVRVCVGARVYGNASGACGHATMRECECLRLRRECACATSGCTASSCPARGPAVSELAQCWASASCFPHCKQKTIMQWHVCVTALNDLCCQMNIMCHTMRAVTAQCTRGSQVPTTPCMP